MDRTTLALDVHIEDADSWLSEHVDFPAPDHLVITVGDDRLRFHTRNSSQMQQFLNNLIENWYEATADPGQDPGDIPIHSTPWTFLPADTIRPSQYFDRLIADRPTPGRVPTSGHPSVSWGNEYDVPPAGYVSLEALYHELVPSGLISTDAQENLRYIEGEWGVSSNRMALAIIEHTWQEIALAEASRNSASRVAVQLFFRVYEAWLPRLWGMFNREINPAGVRRVWSQCHTTVRVAVPELNLWVATPDGPSMMTRANLGADGYYLDTNEEDDIEVYLLSDND